MNCPKCQFENQVDAKFCNKCGSNLEIGCPDCGTSNLPGSGFCKECGHDLSKPKEAPPIDYTQPQSYTPKFLADKILTTRSAIEGERKLVTVLFADVTNYTSIAEKLDPEEVHQIMDGCFKILMDEIHKYEGTINQFTGDGVMALFGAPVAHEDHGQRACHAALSIQKAIVGYGERIREQHGADFKMRIGLNSGPVIVGSIGDDLRMDYTAVGDTTNLAFRMQTEARPASVLVSENTHRLVRDFFECESLGEMPIKGKEEPQEAFELIRPTEVETRIEAAAAKGLTRFVGRRKEMEALKGALDQARDGSGQVVGIVGEAGVGKSRLLIEMRNLLPQNECTYLEGSCLHYGGSMPYLPVLNILRLYFDIKEGEQEFVIRKKIEEKILQLDERLASLLPPFQELLSLKVEDEDYLQLEPAQKKLRTFEAIRDLLIRESESKPLVLAVEDLHWIDETSEEFIGYLIEWLANTQILLILLYRPEYSHRWGSKSYYNRIGLGHLSSESSVELVCATLADAEVAPELKQLILRRAGGNPLFVEEFTHTLVENGTIQKKDRQYVLMKKASEIEVPNSIQGVISARIDRVEENLKRIMQVASVMGREFSFKILNAITGMSEDLKSSLLNLQRLEFISEKRLFPELEYVFKHALIQEVAYNSLLQKKRREIHKSIGRAIEQIYWDRMEEYYDLLAYHYARSDGTEKALHYLELAGDKAVGYSSMVEARSQYQAAIKLLEEQDRTESNKRKHIDLSLKLAKISLMAPSEEIIATLGKSREYAGELLDDNLLAQVTAHLGAAHYVFGNLEQGITLAQQVVAMSEKFLDDTSVGISYYILGVASVFTSNFSDATDYLEKSFPILHRTGNRLFEGHGVGALAYVYGWAGRFHESFALFLRALEIAETNRLPSVEHQSVFWRGCVKYFKGEWDAAVEDFDLSTPIAEANEDVLMMAWNWTIKGYALSMGGHPKEGIALTRKGVQTFEETGIKTVFSIAYSFLGEPLCLEGQTEEAIAMAEKSISIGETGDNFGEIMAYRILAMAAAQEALWDLNKAQENIRESIRLSQERGARPDQAIGKFRYAEILHKQENLEQAREQLGQATSLFREMEMTWWPEQAESLERKLENN